MRLAPIAVALSFLASIGIIGAALWTESGLLKEFENYDGGQWASAAMVLLPLLAVCSWPWMVSFTRALNGVRERSSVIFAVAGVLLAAFFYTPISNAPAEGRGYWVICFVAFAWLAFPLSLLFRSIDE